MVAPYRRIHVLPSLLVNQIAAGEVIDRPASIIKECIENSIDANASMIVVEIEQGGKKSIRITDNGDGIHPDDLLLAVTLHATSKITNVSDLAAITSLGFRGEALASIASVSKLTLRSMYAGESIGSEFKNYPTTTLQPVSHPKGTTVLVESLFYNVPVRQRFLKSDRTEMLHIDELMKRLALSHYQIGFQWIVDKKLIFSLPPLQSEQDLFKRIRQLFGKRFFNESLFLDKEAVPYQLTGWVGAPSFTRNQNDLQYFYVNNRIIKDRMLTHAIRLAYGDSLPVGRYPAYVLYLSLPFDRVDVNVHPTKQEARFHEARMVHDFISHAVTTALQTTHQTILETIENKPYTPRKLTDNASGSIRELGVVGHRYLLVENKNGLIRIDIRSFKRDKLTDVFSNLRDDESIARLPLLIPEQLILSEKEVDALMAAAGVFETYGFEWDSASSEMVLVRSIPALCSALSVKTFIPELALHLVSSPEVSQNKTALIPVLLDLIETHTTYYAKQDLAELLPTLLQDPLLAMRPYCESWLFDGADMI